MADGPILRALKRSLAGMAKHPEDAALQELARAYARGIDANSEMLSVYGRGYRETLMELGMTPRVRAALTKGQVPDAPASPVDELRKRRERRAQ